MEYFHIFKDVSKLNKSMVEMVHLPVTVGFKNIERLEKPTFMQKLISWWTGSKYVHVEIRIGDMWVSAKEGVGVKLMPYEDNTKHPSWDYVDIPNIDIYISKLVAIEKWLNEKNGDKYDWIAIFLTHILKLRIDHKSKWTCSELVSKVLQLLQHQDFIDVRPASMAPKDVANILIK